MRWLVLAVAALLGACGGGGGGTDPGPVPTAPPPDRYVFDLPPGFPEPRAPADMSVAMVELGRHLFYDPRLAAGGNGSCANCHEQRLGFTDARTTSLAPDGDVHPRNAQTLVNAVYNARQNWANPNVRTLREQALLVLLNEDPVELGWAGREQQMLDRFRADGDYVQRFAEAFPDAAEPFTLDNVARALAAFTATLISGNSAFDRGTMSTAARRGEALFNSERLECHHCHNGFNFANSVVHAGTTLDNIEYKNTGLYNIPGPATGYPLASGNYPANNPGLYAFTFRDTDMGRFRPPTLRNVVLTAPYMHDGSIATLREVVVDHYARGGRHVASGPYAGDGARNPNKDALMIGFAIDENEVADLLAFFDALTDWDFVCDERFSDPFGQIPMHEACPASP
ncbi:MbnH family di-heme enzyme [Sinimarinibacterium flocculans]|uniref:MbnH family di-heme enzyme n=1 Tax=Sinimarinibacterium flocculans TaxID=985250 RepID=UPI003512A45B